MRTQIRTPGKPKLGSWERRCPTVQRAMTAELYLSNPLQPAGFPGIWEKIKLPLRQASPPQCHPTAEPWYVLCPPQGRGTGLGPVSPDLQCEMRCCAATRPRGHLSSLSASSNDPVAPAGVVSIKLMENHASFFIFVCCFAFE